MCPYVNILGIGSSGIHSGHGLAIHVDGTLAHGNTQQGAGSHVHILEFIIKLAISLRIEIVKLALSSAQLSIQHGHARLRLHVDIFHRNAHTATDRNGQGITGKLGLQMSIIVGQHCH